MLDFQALGQSLAQEVSFLVVEFLADFCAVELLLEIGKLFVVVLLDLQVCAQSLFSLSPLPDPASSIANLPEQLRSIH